MKQGSAKKITMFLVLLTLMTGFFAYPASTKAAASYEDDKVGQYRINGGLPDGTGTGIYNATLVVTPSVKTINAANAFWQLLLVMGCIIIFLMTLICITLIVR